MKRFKKLYEAMSPRGRADSGSDRDKDEMVIEHLGGCKIAPMIEADWLAAIPAHGTSIDVVAEGARDGGVQGIVQGGHDSTGEPREAGAELNDPPPLRHLRHFSRPSSPAAEDAALVRFASCPLSIVRRGHPSLQQC